MAHIKDIIGEEAFNTLSEDKRKELDKKDFEDVSSGSFISKTRFDQVNEQAKEYKKQVGERDKQINNLKEEYKDVDGLKEKVEQLELDNKTQKETYEKQLSDIAFNNALEKGLGAFSIKDKKLIMTLIDKDKLKVDGDNVIGLKEQIEPLKTSHEYLFDKEIKGTGSFVTGGNNDTQPNKTNFASELGKQRAENMKAKSLTDFAK
ncbi:phage capsid scaffolding protein [Clostridium botulinum A2 117]|uniref:Phage scaffold protein n=1 Tax=Clostridium botulinum CFSAN001627 TaxID=1232189 RepID=M1ZYF2_CLOBO|nr:phage scaffolding protein [Clostridium botulinum]EKN42508.1 phage scaffold protein [Clostridium botulinum CFSAN001627]KEI79107.1 phage capsid scaffolding protein [Clostridium botulinum A2 117]MBN3417956.1 phage capsid protein [Clostridium botulinum]MBN3442643.1 phage capsid protein [Clostridium botulinum]MBY6806678.1 phage scaffolding protein [Clostridium botulinum]